MSEYIISDEQLAENQRLHGKKLLVMPEIVRCRDCRWSCIHDGKTYPKGEAYKGMMYCIVWGDGYQGEWVKPDGYCHRAKRKEGGDD